MKENIVLIPIGYYLSNPLFFSIAEKFSDYRKVYFNTKDPVSWKYDKKRMQKENILNYFDEYCEVEKKITSDKECSKLQKFLEHKEYIKSIKNTLNRIKPAAIIITSDMSYSARICNQWADKNNVPMIIIQPSFLESWIPNYNLKYRIEYLFFNKILNIPLYRKQTHFGNENKNNYLFLWGKYFKRYYKGKSIYNNIYITGNPAFDKYFTNYKKKNVNLHEMLNIPAEKRVITICTQDIDTMFGVDAFISTIEMYKSAIMNNEHLFFVIKIHPREDIEKYNEAFRDLNKGNYKIVKDINLYDLYKIIDIQVSGLSYSSFEAVILGIPIILVNLNNTFKLLGQLFKSFDHFNNEIELRANTAEELSEHIRRCLTEEYKEEFKIKREKYLKSRLGDLDGKSSERVVKKIEEIIKRRHKWLDLYDG